MPLPPYMAREHTENIQIGAIIADPFCPNKVLTVPNNMELCAFYPPVEVKHELDGLLEWFPDQAAPSFWERC